MTNQLNYWTELSVQYANQRNYLDDLFSVYPTIPEGIREIDEEKWDSVFKAHDSAWDILADVLRLQSITRAENDMEQITV